MAQFVKSIGGGIKRTISTLIGNDSNTKGDAHDIEDTIAHSTHRSSPTSPDSQPQYKRARTQYLSPRHPEEQLRARQPHAQSSPHQGRVASSIHRPGRHPRAGQPSASQRRSPSPAEQSERQHIAAPSHVQPSAGDRSFGNVQRARNKGKKPSADEIRLVPGSYPQTEDSIAIPVPKEDWANMTNSIRKPPGGKLKPGNTLNQTGPGVNTLSTYSSRGINVPGSSAKRQKTSHDEQYWNRDVQEEPSATLGRQSSVISLNSQSQETLSHSQKHNGFRQVEHEDVHKMLNIPKKKLRKPKTGVAQPSSPFPRGTDNDPFSVEDDDEVQIVNEQPAPPQSERRPVTEHMSLPNAAQNSSSPIRSNRARQTKEVASAWHTNHRADEERNPALRVDRVEITVPSRKPSIATPMRCAPSPPLNGTFVRDQGEVQSSPAPRQNAAKIREKMKPTSKVAPTTVQSRQSGRESSEDELSQDPIGPKSVRRSDRPKRSPSPNYIIASEFFSGSGRKIAASEATEIPLSSFRLKAGNWKNVHLLYSYPHKLIQFTWNGENLHSDATMIQLGSQHARTVICSLESSNAIILVGAKGNGSAGRIWLEFPNASDRDRFMEVVKHMNEKCNFKRFDERQFLHARQSTEGFFTSAPDTIDPELQAMKHRQGTVSKPMNNRERNIAIQKGILLPETDDRSPTTRKARMRTDFTNRPNTNPAQDYSLPPPTPRTERSTTTRSSQRLQTKVDSKVAQPPEPELVRWTHVNGIPDWDGPLIYPFTGSNRTTVEAEDIARLDDGELLNDNIISFCLRDMEESNPELKDKAHIFNSFFYERLTTLGSGKKGFNYEAVSRWTRTKDLFSLPFVVVPINTQFHWFLVIICNLDQLYRSISLDGLGDDPEEAPEIEPSPTAQEPTQSQSTVQNDMEIPESPQEPKDSDLSQGVNRISLDVSQDQTDEVLAASELKATPRKGKKQGPAPPKMDPTTPALLLLDSLGGSHPQEIKNLKQYAVHEGRDKRALEFEYTELKGMTARGLPQQTNFCDCGVYLIGYMEAFLRDPHEFARKVMSRELDHNNDFADFDPSKKRAEIRERLLDLHRQQTTEKKQKKKEAHLAKMAAKRNSDNRRVIITPAQMSSPAKPSAAYDNSRMVQSSPMKPPPKQMQRSSPPVTSSARRAPPTSDRNVDDDMLFDQAFEHGNYMRTSTAHSHDQPTTIAYEVSFEDELKKAIQEGEAEQDDK